MQKVETHFPGRAFQADPSGSDLDFEGGKTVVVLEAGDVELVPAIDGGMGNITLTVADVPYDVPFRARGTASAGSTSTSILVVG